MNHRPDAMFIEMASYVGDVLSYYADSNLRESLLDQAQERQNIFDIAKTLGYKANNVVPAFVTLDVFQLLPAIGTGVNVQPDYNYALEYQTRYANFINSWEIHLYSGHWIA
jgi:hypothetical protein